MFVVGVVDVNLCWCCCHGGAMEERGFREK